MFLIEAIRFLNRKNISYILRYLRHITTLTKELTADTAVRDSGRLFTDVLAATTFYAMFSVVRHYTVSHLGCVCWLLLPAFAAGIARVY